MSPSIVKFMTLMGLALLLVGSAGVLLGDRVSGGALIVGAICVVLAMRMRRKSVSN